MAQPAPTKFVSEAIERRRVPRIPFHVTSLVAESGSLETVVAVSAVGLGIEFVQAETKDQALLQKWLGNGKTG